MKLQTSLFGEMEIAEEEVVLFPEGLPGFFDCRRFVFLNPDEGSPFSFMQSVDDGALSFVVINPFLFFRDYEFELPDSVVEKLAIESPEDVAVWSIVVVKDPLSESTANLQAPVVVNVKARVGKQVVLNDNRYSRRQSLFVKKVAVGG